MKRIQLSYRTVYTLMTWVGFSLSVLSCHSQPPSEETPALGQKSYEELTEVVPSHFADAQKWNSSTLCPEGASLSPLTRYTFGPEQKNYGFKHYYGRSCNIVTALDEASDDRKPASPKATVSSSILSIVPHGPFIWWYENGKRMSAGQFERGTLANDWSRWTPDGSLASK